jgi:Protein of unknown function (DUF1553)/Protein of unknown function (DUF1549)
MRRFILFPLLVLALGLAEGKDKLKSVSVEPGQIVLTGKWATQRIQVTGKLENGSTLDLTARAQFKPNDSKIAVVSKAGVVTPVTDGRTTIAVVVPGYGKLGRTNFLVTVKDSAGSPATYLNQVRPVIAKLGCSSTECHGAAKGKGGFRLSLFGGDPESDYDAITRSAGGRRVNRVEPLKSLLLAKASGKIAHQGGERLKPGAKEYNIVSEWLVQGAPWSAAKEAHIVSIRLTPSDLVLKKGEKKQILATAVFSDGAELDVTSDASMQSSDPLVAKASTGGMIEAQNFGEAVIVVNYLRQAGVARVLAPQPLAQPFPKLESNNQIDDLVYKKLKALGVPPSGLATDQEFLRRVYIDVIGTLPSGEEVRAYLADTKPNKRARLIDDLLGREEFADYWSLKWGDLLRIKSEYPVRVWPKAVAVYYRWVRQSLAENKPYDQFAKELLTSSGSNFRFGPANFFRAMPSKDPRTIGESTALIFMGARFGCARCHGHPTENWSPDDDLGFGAFFAKMNFKSTMEWKEEIVFPDPKGVLRHPKTSLAVKPAFPGEAALDLAADEDPRMRFAAWLTSPQNPWFAKAIVNRIWFWMMGRGIVNEPDDMRATNPPQNPELLKYLESELTGHQFDLKHIYRLILNSRTYQLSSEANPWNAKDTSHFSHFLVKRLTAEQMLDALSQVTETSEKFRSIIPEPFTNWPVGYRATHLSDGNAESSFLDMLGRPVRDTPFEGERSSDISLKQALYFINSEQLEGKVSSSPRLKRMLQANKEDAPLIEDLYLTTFSRFPSAEEKQRLVDYIVKRKTARAQAVQDVTWAILNAREFLFNH